MKKRTRMWFGGVVLLFGLGCLNYTTAHAVAHHREFAAKHHLPAPSKTIFYVGAVATVIGAGTVGSAFGRRVALR